MVSPLVEADDDNTRALDEANPESVEPWVVRLEDPNGKRIDATGLDPKEVIQVE